MARFRPIRLVDDVVPLLAYVAARHGPGHDGVRVWRDTALDYIRAGGLLPLDALDIRRESVKLRRAMIEEES